MFDKQIIEKCLNMERYDNLPINTLKECVNGKTAHYTFRQIEKRTLLDKK